MEHISISIPELFEHCYVIHNKRIIEGVIWSVSVSYNNKGRVDIYASVRCEVPRGLYFIEKHIDEIFNTFKEAKDSLNETSNN